MLKRALILAALLAMLVPGTAHAGLFSVESGKIIYRADDDSSDAIAGIDLGDKVRFTRFGTAGLGAILPCTIDSNFETVECPKAGVTAIELNLGNENDIAAVNASIRLPVTFNGGDGADGLFGGGGIDTFNGGAGNDNVVARDGQADAVVDCGEGLDTAISDDEDRRISCEEVEGDADGDGVRVPADCDDTRPTIRPGATDVPDNGIDEDCSGVDAVSADRDRDGTPRPQDCNDADAAVRPGAAEALGNEVDENCDGRIDPFPPILGSLRNAWDRKGSGTVNLRLSARRLSRNTAVEMRCSGRGCPFTVVRRRVTRSNQTINLHSSFRNRALRRGTRIEVRLTLPNRIGRVLRYTMGRPGEAPGVEFLCLAPGGRPSGC